MRVVATGVFAVMALLRVPDASADPYAGLTVGAAELVQVEVGVMESQWSVGLRGGFILFSPVAGVSATRYFGEGQDGTIPRHSWYAGGHLMANASSPGLRGGGETIASYLGLRAGYSFAADSGLLLRAELGAVGYVQKSGPEAGPLFAVGVGWRL